MFLRQSPTCVIKFIATFVLFHNNFLSSRVFDKLGMNFLETYVLVDVSNISITFGIEIVVRKKIIFLKINWEISIWAKNSSECLVCCCSSL